MTPLQNNGPIKSLDQRLCAPICIKREDLCARGYARLIRIEAAGLMERSVLPQEHRLEGADQEPLDLRGVAINAIGLEPRHVEIAGVGLFADPMAIDGHDFEGGAGTIGMIDHFRSPPLMSARRRQHRNASTSSVFGQVDDSLISILRKYGLLPAAGLGAAAMGSDGIEASQ